MRLFWCHAVCSAELGLRGIAGDGASCAQSVALEVDSIHVLSKRAWTFTRVTQVLCDSIALKLRVLADKDIGLCSAP